MFPTHKIRLWRLVFLMLAGLSLGASGCVPAVVWLPDSSGFFYLDADVSGQSSARLLRYDLTTKKLVVLNEKVEVSVQPGLRPDGKRLAVAKLHQPEKANITLQVVFYDDQGKEVGRSKAFDWRKPFPKGMFSGVGFPPTLYWSPTGDKIVVYAADITGLFDVQTQTMKIFHGTIVVNVAGSPMLPNKTGFLVFTGMSDKDQEKNKRPTYALIDWQGKTQRLKMSPNLPTERNEELDNAMKILMLAPPLVESHWEKEVANITLANTTLTIDTGKREVHLKKGTPTVLADKSRIFSRFPLAKDIEVRTVNIRVAEDPQNDIALANKRLELLLAGQKPQVLVSGVDFMTATPSPNGEWLALRCSLSGDSVKEGQREMLLLVNRKGEVIKVGAAK